MSGGAIAEYCKHARNIMPSVGIEVQPLSQEDYSACVAHGADHLACYQETYDRETYAAVHRYGRKRDFEWRYAAPERAARAGMRSISFGVLLGLSEPRADVVQCALHARSIADRFPEVTIGFSLPRIRPFAGSFVPNYPVDDTLFVQLMMAYKLWMPHAVISISTREDSRFRDALIPLGANKMSAGSHTEVGGYTNGKHGESQFVINDTRSVVEVAAAITKCGYQPVFKDWHVF
jgi:2-iminoacetate synthase